MTAINQAIGQLYEGSPMAVQPTDEDLADDGGGDDHVALAGDWALWRDFAIRAAGFPVSGLDVFGSGDEGERLREVASDPLFREAVAWQNRHALVTQIDAIAHALPQSPSKRRRREA